MKRSRLLLTTTLALLCGMALLPERSQASTIVGTNMDDQICLFYSIPDGGNVACVNGTRVGPLLTTPVTVFGRAGHDEITIYDDAHVGSCVCDCTGYGPGTQLPFAYGGGTVTVYGELGDEEIAGGNGTNFLFGGDGHDHLRGNADADTLNGELGDDTVLDHPAAYALGGTADKLYGAWDDDCMGDCTTASPNVCDGDSGSDGEITCGGCINTEVPSANCAVTCPERKRGP